MGPWSRPRPFSQTACPPWLESRCTIRGHVPRLLLCSTNVFRIVPSAGKADFASACEQGFRYCDAVGSVALESGEARMASGNELIEALRRKLRKSGTVPTEDVVVEHLGLPSMARLSSLRGRDVLSARELANMMVRVEEAAQARLRGNLVLTLVEFYPIDATPSRRASNSMELFESAPNGVDQSYRKGLEAELRDANGVYIFYDSRGRALYAGKAKTQPLWQEMRSAFNRSRSDYQSVERVNHPTSNVAFRVAAEQDRKIVKKQVPLSELAYYFSAYRVDVGFIDQFEALLIHAFPNDLLNKKKETVHKRPKGSKKAVARKKMPAKRDAKL